jgi:SAM-dependent methyltransferase
LGNVGFSGQAHARGAWFATWLIDQVAYGGINLREEFAQRLAQRYENGTKLLEIGCGVGTLTYELEKTDNFDIVAVDTSQEMIEIAQRCIQSPLLCLNGVDVNETVDVSVVCMVMHELPPCAHRELLRHVLNITALDVWVVDIDPDYQPSLTMLSGEPYVPKYLETIEAMFHEVANETEIVVDTFSLIPGHVRAWKMQKNLSVLNN